MNTFDTLFSRRSVRTYTGDALTEAELTAVLKAANAAPVGRAMYDTLHLTVVQNPALLAQIDRHGAAFFGDMSRTPLYHAPALIVVSTKKPAPGAENVTFSNAAIVAHNMCLAAVEMGLGQCCIWGATAAMAESGELVGQLGLPEGFVPCCSVIVGRTEEKYALREIPTARIGCNIIG